MGLIEYTANDEMPECGQCDHFDGSDGFKCEEWCGPAHGWFGYKRPEIEWDDDIDINYHNSTTEQWDKYFEG